MKKKLKRGWMLALCAAAIVPLAAIPLGWFTLTDAALVGQTHPQKAPYTSVVPTGDDYYLLRQLNTRVELARRNYSGSMYSAGDGVEGMYLFGATYSGGMTYAAEDMQQYRDEVLQTMVDGGVLPQTWYDQVKEEIDYWAAPTYYSTDSLGFLRLKTYVGENSQTCLLNLEVDSRTGKVVALWISALQGHEIDPANALPAWVELNELDGLGDWAVPTGTDYEQSGLYSKNGQALMTCATGVDTYSSSEIRQFLSLQLGPYTKEVEG